MNERVERRGHPAIRHTHPHGARDISRGLFPSAPSLFPLPRAMSLAARILLAASVALLASSEVSAETMDTTNTMDDASDMLADFARYEMDASTLTLVNASTGAPLSERSAAALSDADPETPDDFDLGLFVHASDMDPTVAPGSTVNVTVCDFSRPENCAKAVPYPGAPESTRAASPTRRNPTSDSSASRSERTSTKTATSPSSRWTRHSHRRCAPRRRGRGTPTSRPVPAPRTTKRPPLGVGSRGG